MKKIRMIKGHTVINGKKINTRSGVFEVEDSVADRFVKNKVAVYVDVESTVSSNTVVDSEIESEESSKETDLESLSFAELKEIATSKGISVKGNSKAAYIEAINAASETKEEDEYTSMTDEELAEIATELEIDINGLSRAEIIAKCKEKEAE